MALCGHGLQQPRRDHRRLLYVRQGLLVEGRPLKEGTMRAECVILRKNRYGKQYRRLDRQLKSWRMFQQRRARLAAKKELDRLVEEDLLADVPFGPQFIEVVCPECLGTGHVTLVRSRKMKGGE